ncbi:transposase family protein [Actinorugispora endophytica]|nr:transposase family protein [Actinorugispora endophytica]
MSSSSLISDEDLQPSPDLLERFSTITDPRDARGRRHSLTSILGVCVCALAASGHDHPAAIAEWAARTPQDILAELGVRRDPLSGRHQPPSETTMRTLLKRLDADQIETAGYAHPADLTRTTVERRPRPGEREQRKISTPDPDPRHRPRHRGIAVDGKALRGARTGPDRRVHLLQAVRHHDGTTLAQRRIDGRKGEITGFVPLLAGLDITGAVVTFGALHTQHAHAERIHQADGTTSRFSKPTILGSTRESARCRGRGFPERTGSRNPGTHGSRSARSR